MNAYKIAFLILSGVFVVFIFAVVWFYYVNIFLLQEQVLGSVEGCCANSARQGTAYAELATNYRWLTLNYTMCLEGRLED